MNIIDQQHCLASQDRLANRVDGEGAPHGASPLCRIKTAQGRRSPMAQQHLFFHADTGKTTKAVGNQGGLIKSPPPEPPTVQGNRHQHHRRPVLRRHQSHHLLGYQMCETYAPPHISAEGQPSGQYRHKRAPPLRGLRLGDRPGMRHITRPPPGHDRRERHTDRSRVHPENASTSSRRGRSDDHPQQ
jgi:hypothetical protein